MKRRKAGVLAVFALSLAAGSALSLGPREAAAFCGFYVSGADAKLFNNATQVVLMREGTRTVLSMQNNYQGPPSDFAMVVPVPIVLQQENVKTLPREVFDHVDRLGAPRLVEYWEQDPCRPPEPPKVRVMMADVRGGPTPMAPKDADLGVKIEAQFTVGEYQVVILSANDSTGLDTWLRREGYKIPAGAEPFLRPYVVAGMKFFVAKVDVKKVKFENGMVTLSPLRFHYDSDLFSLPVRLGLMNSSGTQDLIVNILAQGTRYEVANYDNIAIPTNIDVNDNVRKSFPSFYAALFDRAMEKHPKAVITEYSWDAGTCDPCPLPALSPVDLATLGADVLPSGLAAAPNGGAPPGPWRGRGRMMPSGFVLTRLHARYTSAALGEDLVFRAAQPIAGGRESISENGKLERGFIPSSVNNFQARYAIRHPWTGAVKCANPRRGIWGGPPGPAPDDALGPKKSLAATGLAFAPRDAVKLTSFVRAGAALDPGLLASATSVPATISAGISSPPAAGGGEDAGAPPGDADAGPPNPGSPMDAGPSAGPEPPKVPPEAGGCAGCRVGAEGEAGAAGLLSAAAALVGVFIRRRARRR